MSDSLCKQKRVTEMVNTSADIKNWISESSQMQRIIYNCPRKHEGEWDSFPLQKLLPTSSLKYCLQWVLCSTIRFC